MTDCIFCKIANGELNTDFLYEDEDIVAFRDINPRAPVHILIVSKKHIASLADVAEDDVNILGKISFVAAKLALEAGIADSGYRLLTNCRADSGQEVLHLHFHLIGGKFLGAFLEQ